MISDVSKITNKPQATFFQGFLLGVVGLSTFYYLLLFVITGDFMHPLVQFALFQPWMSLLIIGFGVQMGLFWLMRRGVRLSFEEKKDGQMATGASTTISGMAMVACCAHHAVDLLPILGLSALALFLSEYQEQLLIFGVFTNLMGIIMMLWFVANKPKPATILNIIFNKTKEES